MIKLLPYYLYQIDAIESWLDDQAKKGLFLTDVRSGLRFCACRRPRSARSVAS